jgi:hypothetical protein
VDRDDVRMLWWACCSATDRTTWNCSG